MSPVARITTTNVTRTVTLPQDPMTVDWVELGCRGWAIDESGAGIIEPHPLDGPNYVYLDLETLALMFIGDAAFLRRAYDDLVAAGVHGLMDHWTIIPFVQTGNYLPTMDTQGWVCS